MSATPAARTRAPIEYEALRRPYHWARAFAAAFLAVLSLYGTLGLGMDAWPAFLAAVVVLSDALARTVLGRSALPPLLVDITAVGMLIVLSGGSTATQATGLVYVLVAALLMLPLTTAAVAIGYALAWVVATFAVSRWNDGNGLLGPPASAETSAALDLVTALVVVGVIAVLLIGAVKALLAAQDRSRLALEQERRAVQLKNEFVSMVSHELRTPLTGITGFTDALRDWRSLPPEEVDEFLSIMRGETKHLADLVEDILVIPRLEAGYLRLHPEDLDVVAATADAADLMLAGKREYEISLTGPVMVTVDAVRLKQILRNLLGNALKYGGDQVLIEGRHHSPSEYLVVISDNGPGVGEGDRERIFEHFEQLSKGDARLEQGVGLGLPIARKLARAMGGELWYEPRFPVGSHFCFTLPLAASERQAAPDPAEMAQAAG
ncbi:MAG: sensor histidine kinase [Actinobacteria bacterium]|nr:MAG: sensor histidine kinase [Actinomycetota bacterium]